MPDIDRDSLMGKVGSIYKIVIMASQRAIEISEGATKLVDTKPEVKPINIALHEIMEGKISYKVKAGK